MSLFDETFGDVDEDRRLLDERRLKRARGEPVFVSALPKVGSGFVETEPSEEEFIGSGEAREAKGHVTLKQAIEQSLGERERYTGNITLGGYLNEKLGDIITLPVRAGRAISGPTFIDESGKVVGPGGRPAVTDAEFVSLAAEMAGYGVGVGQAGKYGTTLVEKATNFLREKLRRAPTPQEVKKVILALPAGEPGAVERSAARQANVAKGVVEGPTRVIEAPPARPGESLSALRQRMREVQGAEVGEYDPTGPHARVIREPPLREVITGPEGEITLGRQGQSVPVEPRPVGGPTIRERINRAEGVKEPVPGEHVTGPSTVQRMERRGWTREEVSKEGDPSYTLKDSSGKTIASIVESEIPGSGRPGFAPTRTYDVLGPDGKSRGTFSSLDEAAEKFPKTRSNILKARFDKDKPRKDEPPPPPSSPTAPVTKLAAVTPDSSEPYTIIDRVTDKYKTGYNTLTDWWRPVSAQTKSVIGINTPTEISRVYPTFGQLVEKTKIAKDLIESRTNDVVSAAQAIVKDIGEDEFSRLLKLRDDGKPLSVSPSVEKRIDDFWNMTYAMTDGLPTQPIFKEGFQKRLKQSLQLRGATPEEVKEYFTEDIRRILPGERRGVLRERLMKELTGDEPYTLENVYRMVRATARQSVMGTSHRDGYMKDIKPLLQDLADKPDIIKKEVDDYVNYFIGAPGSRSAQTLQRWADRSRAIQYASKITGNFTSPIWNTGQNFLTFAETDVKSFSQAWGDALRHYNAWVQSGFKSDAGDPQVMALLKRAKLDHQLAAPSLSSDIGMVPTDLLNKFDQGLGRLNDFTGYVFRSTERNNRLIAFLAGHKDGIARGMNDVDAIKHGKTIMDKTQFTGAEADLPKLFRKAGGSTVGQFKTFIVKYGEYMKNNAADAVKAAVDPNLSGQERLDNVRKFTKFWGSQVAMAGPVGAAGTIPFLGSYIEEAMKDQPEWAQRGFGGLIGVDLARQFGAGVLPIKSTADLLFQLPGATFNTAQDVLSIVTGDYYGNGMDVDKDRIGKPLTWDEWERKVVRLFPIGVQAARFIEGVKTHRGEGMKHKALTGAEAFGLETPSGRAVSEVEVNSILEAVGIREAARERESEITKKARENENIETTARTEASELYVAGKYAAAQAVLKKASEKLGREILMRPGNISGAHEAQFKTATERLRERSRRRGVVIPEP